MSRFRKRRRTKPEVVIVTAGATIGLGVLILCGIAVSYAKSIPKYDAPPAEKTQFSLTANDSGKTFTYAAGAHFSVFLSEANYKKDALRCSPAGVVGNSTSLGVPPKGMWVRRFEAVSPGSCTLTDKDFEVTIVVR
jgi:hypothetical protein